MSRVHQLLNRCNYGFLAVIMLLAQLVQLAIFVPVADAVSSGAKSPTLVTNESAGSNTVAWTDTSLAVSNNGQRAKASLDDQQTSRYLKATGFGFSLPSNAVIKGIKVDVERRSKDTDSSIKDNAVQIVKNNVVRNEANKALNSWWSSSDNNVVSYGSTTDLWGNSWTAADINSSTFGVAISAKKATNNGGKIEAGIDYVQIAVEYTVPVTPATNPSLGQSCGLDIAIVIDRSASIALGNYLDDMQNAAKAFTGALASTPTKYSVVQFGTGSNSSDVLANWTNAAGADDAIDDVTTDGNQYTNWEAALNRANTLFDGATPADTNNLVLFLTDGDPTASTDNPNGPTDVSQIDASNGAPHLNPAITAANNLKNKGVRIQAVGIGTNGSGSISRLTSIASSDAVITTNFNNLAKDLKKLATDTCGGTITVNKVIDRDGNLANGVDGTGYSLQNWSYTVKNSQGQTVDTLVTNANGQDVTVKLNQATYSVDEDVKTNFEVFAASCTGGSFTYTGNGSDLITGITVNNNSIVSCTFYNRPTTGTVTVKKIVSGGTAKKSDFKFKNNDGAAVNFESDGSNELTLSAGSSFSISEESYPYYTPSYSGDCSGTVVAGVNKTCTITNTYHAPAYLTLVKKVVNDNGGTLSPTQVTLTAAGSAVYGELADENVATNGVVTEGRTTKMEVAPGTYVLSENNNSAYYTKSAWSCDKTTVNGSSITVKEGDNIVCEITNNDIAPFIVINKIVNNPWGGNTASPDSFLLKLDGNSISSGAQNQVSAGKYTVGETLLKGYEFGSFTGDNCFINGLTLEATAVFGGITTCTLTNNAVQPKLTLVKAIEGNQYGDTATVNDFGLTVDGSAVSSGVATGVNVGEHVINEAGLPGYEFVRIDGEGCPEILGGAVSIELGDDITCTIVNKAIEPKLTLIKVIEGEQYGDQTLPEDFNLRAEAAPVLSYKASPLLQVVEPAYNVGQYAITEDDVFGYEFDRIEGEGCPEAIGGTLTLRLGDDITCTVYNKTIPPTVTVIKHVVNDNGGTATVADFGITANGQELSWDEGVVSGDTTTYTATFTPDTSSVLLSEADHKAYTEGKWSCSNEAISEGLTLETNVGLGGELTCEITNNDIEPGKGGKDPEPLPNTSGSSDQLIAMSLLGVTLIASLAYGAIRRQTVR